MPGSGQPSYGPPPTALGVQPYAPSHTQPPFHQPAPAPYGSMYPALARVDTAPQQRGTRSFDMGRQAAREATIRRLVWLIVLVVAGIVGIILATQL